MTSTPSPYAPGFWLWSWIDLVIKSRSLSGQTLEDAETVGAQNMPSIAVDPVGLRCYRWVVVDLQLMLRLTCCLFPVHITVCLSVIHLYESG